MLTSPFSPHHLHSHILEPGNSVIIPTGLEGHFNVKKTNYKILPVQNAKLSPAFLRSAKNGSAMLASSPASRSLRFFSRFILTFLSRLGPCAPEPSGEGGVEVSGLPEAGDCGSRSGETGSSEPTTGDRGESESNEAVVLTSDMTRSGSREEPGDRGELKLLVEPLAVVLATDMTRSNCSNFTSLESNCSKCVWRKLDAVATEHIRKKRRAMFFRVFEISVRDSEFLCVRRR